ncbi:hypothetical protein T439DRAFT_304642 [Meredithblackwellia eburnea MCA 4105]
MPRPRQRRGADAKKEEKKLKREHEEQEARAREAAEKRARHRKSEMNWDALNVAHPAPGAATDSSDANAARAAMVDPDALPEPDPDTKAYFRQVAAKIQELEELGHGRGSYSRQDLNEQGDGGYDYDKEAPEDDRPYLLRSALESLSGQEIPLAGDSETSLILEKLLYSMDDFARRVLADRFMGSYPDLVKHRSASHVLQTLFTLAGETVDRETRGIIASGSSASTSSTTLPSMTDLLLSALSEILPTLPVTIYDSFGSHTLRVLLLVFSGTAPAVEGSSSAERSKKSLTWRKQQGPMKSFLTSAEDENGFSVPKGEKRAVPSSFGDALKRIWESLDGLDDGGPKGEGVRRASMDNVAGPAIRIMIEMEADSPEGWKAGGWADRVLCGLVEEGADPSTATEQRTEQRSEFLNGLLRHPASSPTFETLLTKGSHEIFKLIWDDLFKGKLHRLAGNAVANFVVAVGISRLDEEGLRNCVQEIKAIATERRGEWIDNFRTGVLNSLVKRCAELRVSEKEVSEILLDTFSLYKPEDLNLLVPCVLSLHRLEHYRKLASPFTDRIQMQGSILLQSWLKLSNPHQQPVITSLIALPFEQTLPLTQSTISSRVFDALLTSATTPPASIRKFLMGLIGHYHTIADDRIGSRVVERCWAVADVYLKDKIAASLVKHQLFLQQSSYGHFFARKLELPLWERRREQWKAKMAAQALEAKEKAAAVVKVEEKKQKRVRPQDEMDDIFASASSKGGVAPAGDARLATKSKVPRTEGLEDVLGAIKASV